MGSGAGPAVAAPPVGAGGPAGTVVFDPTPHINAVEQGLKDWLNKPTRDILDQLNLNPDQRPPDGPPGAAQREAGSGGQPGDAGGAPGGDMVSGLMSPMLEMLGTLGTGLFEGLNPQQMFEPVSQAFQQGAQSLQGLMGQLGQSGSGWAGAGAAGTAAKTAATLGNGAAVSAQGAELGAQGATAGADTTQAHTRLLELIIETQHRLEALSAGLPWTSPEMGRTAGEATARAVEIVSELEAALTAQAASMTATGAPVAVTEAPSAMTSMMGPMLQVAMSMIGPGVQLASMPLTMGTQLLSQGVQGGAKAATGLAQALGKSGSAAPKPAAGLGTSALPAAAAIKTGGGGGGSGGGGAGTLAARALPTAMPTNLASASGEPAAAQSATGRGGVGAAGTPGMMGAPGAAGAGANRAGLSSGDHTAASYLHTTDQGGEIIGDMGVAVPPVIGEADPHADSDGAGVRGSRGIGVSQMKEH